jgi:hypothetical protein
MAFGNQLIHNFELAFIPNFFIEAAYDGLVLRGHWGSSPRTVISDIFGDQPCLTEPRVRKLGMARLEKAYSRGVWLAMVMDGNVVTEERCV